MTETAPKSVHSILKPVRLVVRTLAYVGGAFRGFVKRLREPAPKLSRREERRRRKELVKTAKTTRRRAA